MRNISTNCNIWVVFLCAVIPFTACDSSYSLAGIQLSPNGTAQSNVNSNVVATQSAGSASKEQKALPPLITAEDLATLVNSKTEGIKILEPGAKLKVFSKGHLPTAQFLHWIDDLTDPAEVAKYNNPGAKQFSQVMSRMGIKNSDRIIIYDRFSSRLSTRLFWTLKTFGHDQVQVLDGGFAAGKSKLKLSTEIVEAIPSQYKVTATSESMIADLNMVRGKLADSNCRLIDGRPEQQFSGEKSGEVFHTGKAHSRKGHIPGAKNVFWKDNFKPDGTFKSVAQLKALYQSADILPANDVITYCNEGLHAAPPWFVLTQLLDYKNVRLYDSSMAEWAESKEPMEILPQKK